PLVEVGLRKQQVRDLARQLRLPAWDKPATACLASRIPRLTPITPELLKQVERAENVLAGLGFRQFRVRHHGKLARIEVPHQDLGGGVGSARVSRSALRELGYAHVTRDLAGYAPTGPARADESAVLPERCRVRHPASQSVNFFVFREE